MNNRTCNNCNRPLVGRQKKFCSHQCANSVTAKAIRDKAAATEWNICTVGGCEKRARSRIAALCPMHYHRVYRNGTLDHLDYKPPHIDITGKRYGKLIAERRLSTGEWELKCECGAKTTCRYGNLDRGDKITCGNKKIHYRIADNYRTVHQRLKADHGPAKQHPCVGCGKQAAHWSYNHDDPNEMYFDDPRSGSTIAYSVNEDSYSPRCVSCHKRFDLQRANSNGANLRVA